MRKPVHKISPYDARAIQTYQYANLVAGHYRMTGNYHIKRPAGTHDWLLILTLSGRGRIHHADGGLILQPGQIAAFMPETPHDYRTNPATGRWELLWVHFHPLANWLQLLDWPLIAPGVRLLQIAGKKPAGKRIASLFHEIHRTSVSSLPLRDWLAINLLETMLIYCHGLSKSEQPAVHPLLEAAKTYIHEHQAGNLSLRQLARECRLSISHLSALFRRQLHTTPQRYIEASRMDMAKRLMQFSNRSIKEIAGDVGFTDPLYFSRRFRKSTGLSPQVYRRRNKHPSS